MRSKYAILNFISTIFRNGVGLLLSIIATPIILNGLGEEQFAVFRILLDWFSHLSLMEYGLYGAALSFFSKILAEKKEKLGAALYLIMQKYTKIISLQILCLIFFILFFKYLIPVSNENYNSAWWAFVVLSISTFFGYTQIFRSLLEASQRGYVVSYVMVAQNVMYLSLAVCFAYMSFGLIGQVVAYTVSLLFMLVFYMYVCKEKIILLSSKEVLVEEDVQILNKQRKNLFLNELFGRVAFMSDNLVVMYILGAKAVTAFYLTQRLAQLFQQQLQNISNSSWPALGELYYTNKKDVLSSRISELTELTAAFSGILLGGLIVMNKSFMYLWTGQATYSGDITTYFACWNAGLFAIVSLWGWCLAAINRTDKSVPVFFTQVVINSVGSLVFTYTFGINGPLMGTFFGLGAVAIWWLGKIIADVFHISYIHLMFKWLVSFALPLTCIIILHYFIEWPVVNSWILFFMQYFSITAVLAVVSYFILLSQPTKIIFVEKIKFFISRKK